MIFDTSFGGVDKFNVVLHRPGQVEPEGTCVHYNQKTLDFEKFFPNSVLSSKNCTNLNFKNPF